MAGKFEITTRKNGEFQLNLKASNGQAIGSSQMYSGNAACRNGIASVKTHAPDAEVSDLAACPPVPCALAAHGPFSAAAAAGTTRTP